MCVQEEITQGVVSLSVETGKMTADLLQKAVKKVLEEMQKKPSLRTLHQGKQTLHHLVQDGALGVRDHIGGMALEQVGLDEKPRFA